MHSQVGAERQPQTPAYIFGQRPEYVSGYACQLNRPFARLLDILKEMKEFIIGSLDWASVGRGWRGCEGRVIVAQTGVLIDNYHGLPRSNAFESLLA